MARAAIASPQPSAGDGAHGTRRQRGLDLPVYVDGTQVAVLRYGDLPPITDVGGASSPAFRLADYLEAIGVSRVQSVFFYDRANKIGSVEGKELGRDQARFVLRFSAGTTGVAETGWDTVGLKNRFVVHEIGKVAVFVEKPPPAIHSARQCVLTAEGTCSDAVPYQAAPPAKGTRVYLDGKLVGHVKRRALDESLVVGGTPGAEELSLTRLARSFGVDTAEVTGIDVLSGDDVVARADAAQWARLERDIVFVSPRHQHGKVRVRVPAEMQAPGAGEERDCVASSVRFYARTRPRPGTSLVAISNGTDLAAQLGTNDADLEDARGQP